jgi:hypothetical protein
MHDPLLIMFNLRYLGMQRRRRNVLVKMLQWDSDTHVFRAGICVCVFFCIYPIYGVSVWRLFDYLRLGLHMQDGLDRVVHVIGRGEDAHVFHAGVCIWISSLFSGSIFNHVRGRVHICNTSIFGVSI